MDVKHYWREIRQIAARFDPEALDKDRNEEDPAERVHLRRSEKPVWLISVENREKGSVAGMVVEMKPYAAAERIFAATHRLANEQEIKTEISRRALAKERIEEEERQRKGNNAKDIGEAIAGAILQGQSGQKPAPRRGATEPVGA